MLAQIESQMVDNLLQAIGRGDYKEHGRFPSENELAVSYDIPRINARKALLKLEDMGYIYSKQGKGRFLKPEKLQIELHLTGSTSFSEKMKSAGHDLETQNLGYVKVPYDAKVYSKLRVQQADEVFKISRLHSVNKQPIALHISYVAKSVFPQIERDGDHIQSMFAYYGDQGFTDFASNESHVSISFPTSVESSLFECASLVPLLVVESDCIETNQDNVLEYTKLIYRSDFFNYVLAAE
ncbi:GntR family transcriptional regulator [Sporosarcina sp. G11-34]|nr:GntR family transcriptional regulator [Sporosarcina sp. G11-34]